jgi:hypothetical protein
MDKTYPSQGGVSSIRQPRQFCTPPYARARGKLIGTCAGPTADGFPLRQSRPGGPGGLPRPIRARARGHLAQHRRPPSCFPRASQTPSYSGNVSHFNVLAIAYPCVCLIGIGFRRSAYLSTAQPRRAPTTKNATQDRQLMSETSYLMSETLDRVRKCAPFYGFVRTLLFATPHLFPVAIRIPQTIHYATLTYSPYWRIF